MLTSASIISYLANLSAKNCIGIPTFSINCVMEDVKTPPNNTPTPTRATERGGTSSLLTVPKKEDVNWN